MVCYDRTIFERVQKHLNIEKIIFKVVQMKFLEMHITNQKLSFDIFTVQNIFMEHDLNILMIFGIKEKSITLTHTMYFCAAYDWFCGAGSDILMRFDLHYYCWHIDFFESDVEVNLYSPVLNLSIAGVRVSGRCAVLCLILSLVFLFCSISCVFYTDVFCFSHSCFTPVHQDEIMVSRLYTSVYYHSNS